LFNKKRHERPACHVSKNTACRRRAVCYIANDLQSENLINRRTRERIFVAWAVLSLAVWLFMAAAEIYSPLHAWLHGGTIPEDDDDCAIVAIAHGKIETVACDIPVVAPITWIEVTPRVDFSVFIPVNTNLSFGRAPPALPAVS
jgi:hypothetical protein